MWATACRERVRQLEPFTKAQGRRGRSSTHLDDVAEDLEDLALGEAVLQPRVHHVDDAAACAQSVRE